MHLFASGFPCESLFFRSEYISVIDCKVLPRPISSARIAPVPPYRSFFMPWTHSKTKETPSRLCDTASRRRRLAPPARHRRDGVGLIFDADTRWCGRSHWQSKGGTSMSGVSPSPSHSTKGSCSPARRHSRRWLRPGSLATRNNPLAAASTASRCRRRATSTPSTREGGLGRRPTDGTSAAAPPRPWPPHRSNPP